MKLTGLQAAYVEDTLHAVTEDNCKLEEAFTKTQLQTSRIGKKRLLGFRTKIQQVGYVLYQKELYLQSATATNQKHL